MVHCIFLLHAIAGVDDCVRRLSRPSLAAAPATAARGEEENGSDDRDGEEKKIAVAEEDRGRDEDDHRGEEQAEPRERGDVGRAAGGTLLGRLDVDDLRPAAAEDRDRAIGLVAIDINVEAVVEDVGADAIEGIRARAVASLDAALEQHRTRFPRLG